MEGRREDMRADEQVGGEEKNLMWQEEGTGGKQEEDWKIRYEEGQEAV